MPRRLHVRFVAVVLWLAVVAGAAVSVMHVQASARRDLEARFVLQATEGARFAQFYVDGVFRQQHDQAARLLSAAASGDQFELVTCRSATRPPCCSTTEATS